MLPKIIHQSLLDILDCIAAIENYLAEFMGDRRDFNVYMQKRHLRRSVERELEIIGEATNRILKVDGTFDIGNARKIVNLRNHVIHGYDKIEDGIIWVIINKYLPTLRAEVERLLP